MISKELTEKQEIGLQALEAMPEEDIDFSDIPDRPIAWSTAQRGILEQPAMQEVSPDGTNEIRKRE